MLLKTKKQKEIIKRTKYLLNTASQKYNGLPKVAIKFQDNNSMSHASVLYKNGKFSITYSKEAVEKYFEETLTQTCPHEVAHIIAIVVHNNSSHNRQWERICIDLGGNGERCAKTILTPKRFHKYYKYKLDSGAETWLSLKQHTRCQKYIFKYTFKRTDEVIKHFHYTGTIGTKLDIIKATKA